MQGLACWQILRFRKCQLTAGGRWLLPHTWAYSNPVFFSVFPQIIFYSSFLFYTWDFASGNWRQVADDFCPTRLTILSTSMIFTPGTFLMSQGVVRDFQGVWLAWGYAGLRESRECVKKKKWNKKIIAKILFFFFFSTPSLESLKSLNLYCVPANQTPLKVPGDSLDSLKSKS